MENLIQVYRLYREIAGPADVAWTLSTGRKLRTWLRDDLLPVIHRLGRRSTFRKLASWPVENLSRGATSEERVLLDGVDDSIVAAARKLLPILRSTDVRRGLGARAQVQRVVREKVLLRGNSPKRTGLRIIGSSDLIEEAQSSVSKIARRFWTDLVSERDYFEPQTGWLTKEPSALQWGEFIVSLNPELHQGGDFVSRCAMRRIESLLESLDDAHALVHAADVEDNRQRRSPSNARRESIEALGTVRERARSLRHRLLEDERQPLRDACILLTQVGAALSSEFDISWLAVPSDADRGVASMGHRLRNHEKKEVFERVAAALACLYDHYAKETKVQNDLDEAIAGQGLVIVRDSREAYWRSEKIPTTWSKYPKEWLLLVRLAEKGQRGLWVGDDDSVLYPEPPSASAISTLRGRLRIDIPDDLDRLIVRGGQVRSLRLELPRTQISIF
jgi:hypothetical protein